MLFAFLCIMAVLPGSLATLVEHVNSPMRLAERHHSHHDTYAISPDFLRALVVAMLLMGCLGVLLGSFCAIGLFDASWAALLTFVDAFTCTMLAMWFALCRYKISLFEDRAVITPLLGGDICFFYADIQEMTWTGIRRNSGYRDLLIRENDGDLIRVRGLVDIEQVLLHVDRFDVLSPVAGDPDAMNESIEMRLFSWRPVMREPKETDDAQTAATAADAPSAAADATQTHDKNGA